MPVFDRTNKKLLTRGCSNMSENPQSVRIGEKNGKKCEKWEVGGFWKSTKKKV